MLKESVVADVATLDRSPAIPRVALVIQQMLGRNTPASVIQRVAGGPTNLHHILATYLQPGPVGPPPVPGRPGAFGQGPKRSVRTRALERWERRSEVLRIQLDNDRRLRTVQSVVCSVFNVLPEGLAGRSLARDLARARAAFCLLSEAHIMACGVVQITGFIGRNHSTMHHYYRHLDEWMGEELFRYLYGIADADVVTALREG